MHPQVFPPDPRTGVIILQFQYAPNSSTKIDYHAIMTHGINLPINANALHPTKITQYFIASTKAGLLHHINAAHQ
jgi:hypothetical protein